MFVVLHYTWSSCSAGNSCWANCKNEPACLLHHAVNLWKNNGASRNLWVYIWGMFVLGTFHKETLNICYVATSALVVMFNLCPQSMPRSMAWKKYSTDWTEEHIHYPQEMMLPTSLNGFSKLCKGITTLYYRLKIVIIKEMLDWEYTT